MRFATKALRRQGRATGLGKKACAEADEGKGQTYLCQVRVKFAEVTQHQVTHVCNTTANCVLSNVLQNGQFVRPEKAIFSCFRMSSAISNESVFTYV